MVFSMSMMDISPVTKHERSFIYELDVRSKLLWLIVVMGLAFYFSHILSLVALFSVVVVYGYLSKTLDVLRKMVRFFILIMLIVLSLAFIVTKNLSYCLQLGSPLIALIIVFVSGLLFAATTPPQDFAKFLEKMRIPRLISITLTMALSSITILARGFKDITDAAKIRGLNLKNPFKDLHAFHRILTTFTASLIRISNERADAAESRGFSSPCKKTRLRDIKFRTNDYVFLFFLTVVSLTLLIVDGGLGGLL